MKKNLKTAVFHPWHGIGDLVWHIPYFKELARSCKDSKISIIARPACLARPLLEHESWVDQVIYWDYSRRKMDTAKVAHKGLRGKFKIISELKEHSFDQILIYSKKTRPLIYSILAGIPHRSSYGHSWSQRALSTDKKFIPKYNGPSSPVYWEATDFSLKQGLCSEKIVPKFQTPSIFLEKQENFYELSLKRTVISFSIGSSERDKDWGIENYIKLVHSMADSPDASLSFKKAPFFIALGGPAEADKVERFNQSVDPKLGRAVCSKSILDSAAILANSNLCLGNDTGMLNLAAACNTPALGLFGATPLLLHDPILTGVEAQSMKKISVAQVEKLAFKKLKDLGF